MTNFCRILSTAEGAFKKLKPEPNSGLSSVSGSGMSSPGSGISSLPHAGHTPTTVSCPTPARRRHRTTFTQVSRERRLADFNKNLFKLNFLRIFLSLFSSISIFSRMVNRNNWQSWKQLLQNHIIPISIAVKNWRELQSWTRHEYRWESQWTLIEFLKPWKKSIFELDINLRWWILFIFFRSIQKFYEYVGERKNMEIENWKSIWFDAESAVCEKFMLSEQKC